MISKDLARNTGGRRTPKNKLAGIPISVELEPPREASSLCRPQEELKIRGLEV